MREGEKGSRGREEEGNKGPCFSSPLSSRTERSVQQIGPVDHLAGSTRAYFRRHGDQAGSRKSNFFFFVWWPVLRVLPVAEAECYCYEYARPGRAKESERGRRRAEKEGQGGQRREEECGGQMRAKESKGGHRREEGQRMAEERGRVCK